LCNDERCGIPENSGMATKTFVSTQTGKDRLPVAVNVPDPMRYFANDGAAIRLVALFIVKLPLAIGGALVVLHWLR
jgi:hypothetical protein